MTQTPANCRTDFPHSPFCLETAHTEHGLLCGHRSLFQKADWQGNSPNKSHSLLLTLAPSSPAQEKAIFSREGDPSHRRRHRDPLGLPFDSSHRKKRKKRKKSTPHSGHPSQQVWGNGVQHIRFRKKPGTEKEAGLVLSVLVRLPVASAAAILCWKVCNPPPRLRASLLPAHINQGSDGRKEVWTGRSGGLGLRGQRPPPLEVGRGRFMVLSVCLFVLLLDRPCHLTVPLWLSCH